MKLPNVKFVHTQSEMPTGPHWAIITYESRYIEGDERSRTNPGHGYPGHTENYVSYQAYDNEAEWTQEVAKLASSKYPKPFTAMRVIPAKVTTSVNVSVAVE